jgi:hypothetical protein
MRLVLFETSSGYRNDTINIGLEQSEIVGNARGCFSEGFGSADLKEAK